MGKNGSTWKHGWVPTNPAAAKLKARGGKGATPAVGGAKARKPAKAKTGGQLSKAYVSGKGATPVDVKTLVSNYVIMHGKPPTAKQIAKIKRAK